MKIEGELDFLTVPIFGEGGTLNWDTHINY